MNRFLNQLNHACKIIQEYKGDQPFHLWLKEYFNQNKQFGSKDRRFYRNATYGYWRFGKFYNSIDLPVNIAIGLWMQGINIQETENFLNENKIDLSEAKNKIITPFQNFKQFIDPKIKFDELSEWFFTPPQVFIVTPSNKLEQLKEKLNTLSIPFEKTEFGMMVPSGQKLDDLINEGYCRIMDLGSQNSVKTIPLTNEMAVWDCCAGGGGKSLMIKQLFPNITLYSSDLREKSIQNLQQRFKISGMKPPFIGINNLNKPQVQIKFNPEIIFTKPVFDCIIADVPCSGSGTWRHNPENIHFYQSDEIKNISKIQTQIVKNATPFLKKGGLFIYITCSIFESENELNSNLIAVENNFEIIGQSYCGGNLTHSDYLYQTIFKKK